MFSRATRTCQMICTALYALALFSCGGGEETAIADAEVTTDTLSAKTRMNLQLIRVGFPDVVEVTKNLSDAGLSYNKNILNSPGKHSGYSSKYKAGINLGVYGADMSYAAVFQQRQDVLDYMDPLAQLSERIGIGSAFDKSFVENISGASGSPDTLRNTINEVYVKAFRQLRSHERISTIGLVVAGGWLEGLYISCESLGGKKRDTSTEKLYMDIFEHITVYQSIRDLLNEYTSDQDCGQLLKDLTEAKVDEIYGRFSKNAKLQLEDVEEIKTVVSAFRQKVTG